MTRVRNDLFDAGQGLDRGRPKLVEAIWYLVKCFLFLTPLPFPSRVKCAVLRWFGARVGSGVIIKPRVNIHFPWKLAIGDHTWIGEEVFILNFEPVTIGSHCCISQRAFICTGNHDYRQVNMPFRNRPITIEDGAWVGAQSFVSPGVTIGSEAVITVGSVVTHNQPGQMICAGNPCVPVKARWRLPQKAAPALSAVGDHDYRRILGIRFFVGDAPEAVEIGARGGLVVVPAAPALLELRRDEEYRRALLAADLAITDSGFLVLLWNIMMWDRIHRVSGLEYLKLLLNRPEFREPGATFWVMPSQAALDRNLRWLKSQGFPVSPGDCYIAPKYVASVIIDNVLVEMVNQRKPRHIIIGLGGGVQEKLGLCLKQHCPARPAIHCIGAAIGFLSGDQVRIPHWADQWVLGWFFRCLANPGRFVPRYAKALLLPVILWRYRGRIPDLQVES